MNRNALAVLSTKNHLVFELGETRGLSTSTICLELRDLQIMPFLA
jgi:hypothetical protein